METDIPRYCVGPLLLEEKRYKSSVNPETREVRKLATPLVLRLSDCKLVAILNKHHIHTSCLRLIFRHEDPEFTAFLQTIWSEFPVAAEKKFSGEKLVLNVGRYLDASFDSYGKQGALDSVKQEQRQRLHCGQTGLIVVWAITGINSRGFETRLLQVESEGQVCLKLDDWSRMRVGIV